MFVFDGATPTLKKKTLVREGRKGGREEGEGGEEGGREEGDGREGRREGEKRGEGGM